jgi:hypothetical protein
VKGLTGRARRARRARIRGFEVWGSGIDVSRYSLFHVVGSSTAGLHALPKELFEGCDARYLQ